MLDQVYVYIFLSFLSKKLDAIFLFTRHLNTNIVFDWQQSIVYRLDIARIFPKEILKMIVARCFIPQKSSDLLICPPFFGANLAIITCQ